MEATTMINLDPTKTLGIGGFGCHKYWLIGTWSESESPCANFSGLATLGLEEFGFATRGALMLMIIWGPHLAPM